ncbi:MAG: hypothetical protein HGA85_04550, partial [Nanoarchaeota archaeon]|nr:hypothetical protein [Nanoarchaeota archaeon]
MKEPPKPKEEGFYAILFIASILGIILAFALSMHFRQALYDRPDRFSEVFFPDPENLPNFISLGQNYSYSFVIRSSEESAKRLNYTTGIELYKIYNITESKYGCVARYQPKIFMDWTNESVEDWPYTRDRLFDQVQRLMVKPNYMTKINWSYYTIEASFPPVSGPGELVFYFSDENSFKYKVSLDQSVNRTMINGAVLGYSDLSKGNNLLQIKAREGNVSVFLNSKPVASAAIYNISNGTFGIATQDSYIVISSVLVYQDRPLAIPDNPALKRYAISDGFIHGLIGEIRGFRSRALYLQRTYDEWNHTINCEKESF